MAGRAPHPSKAAGRVSDRTLFILFLVLSLGTLGVISRYALLTVLLDGLSAFFVIGPAIGLGLWLVPLFRFEGLPVRWHVLLGAALGLGVLSLLTLTLGLAGVLERSVWMAILGVFAVAGVVRLRVLLRGDEVTQGDAVTPNDPNGEPAYHGDRFLWFLAYPFLVLALLAASTAPGFIWSEEGFGYDVLEYHLQLPKEYWQAGRIAYVPHNVYANFPANVEMLYLLGMIVLDDAVEAGVTANMIHLSFALLTVLAAWNVGRDRSPRCGVVCGVVTACCGWLVYLSGLAYVENGLLFFGMVAVGAISRAEGNGRENRWIVLSGICAGFACGCKYTAVPMIGIPLALGVVFLAADALKRRLSRAALLGLGTLATLSPWLVKNQVMTGNPVFPLMNRWFEASPPGWGAEQTQQWERGHALKPDQHTISARLLTAWGHGPRDKYQRFGLMIFLLAAAGFFVRQRTRVDWLLLGFVALQLAVWLFTTHLFARFAIPMLIPLVLLAGRRCDTGLQPAGTRFGAPQDVNCSPSVARHRSKTGATVFLFVVVGAAWNFAFAAKLQWSELPLSAPASLIHEGKLPGYEYFQVVNRELPKDAKVLLIGDAKAFYFQREVDYCVVFNRHPLIEVIGSAQTDGHIVEWLREQGYTHVLVNWLEIARLSSTYGFPKEIDVALFDRLGKSGLSLMREFQYPQTSAKYVTLYQLTK